MREMKKLTTREPPSRTASDAERIMVVLPAFYQIVARIVIIWASPPVPAMPEIQKIRGPSTAIDQSHMSRNS